MNEGGARVTGNVLRARLRSSQWRRLAIVLFAAPAIVIGLLAMHPLTTSGMSESGGSPVLAIHNVTDTTIDPGSPAVAARIGLPAPVVGCDRLCGPSHDTLGMICVLALLFTMVMLTLHLVLLRWEELRRIISALVAMAAALAPPAPPSLHVLSISRT